MGFDDATSDKTRYGVARDGPGRFLICQTGGGYAGKFDPKDGLIHYRWSPDSKISEYWVNDYNGGGNLTSAPAATYASGKTLVVARGRDNNIWYKSGPEVSCPWEPLPGGLLSSSPAICAEGGNVHVFARGANNQLWHTYKTSKAGWTNWEGKSIPALPVGMKSAPSVAAPAPGRIDVVVQGGDDQVWHLYYHAPSGWSQWETLGGTVDSAPTCCWWGFTGFHVFVRGLDGQVWHTYFASDGSRGAGWYNPDNPAVSGWGKDVPPHPKGHLTSAPVALADGSSRVTVFAGNAGAEIWTVEWIWGQGWQSWKPVGIHSVSYK